MRALVTGAAGFIGSHVAEECVALGMDVVATDDLSGGFIENVPAGARFVGGDLRDPAFIQSLFYEDYDYVYHLAAYAAEGLSHFIRSYNYAINLQASVLLINEAIRHDVERFVFTSSIAVYGKGTGKGREPFTEDMTPAPEDPYGISKLAVELDLAAARDMFGLDYTIFRPHNVYGERQSITDPYRNVIAIFMARGLAGEPMPIFGDGLQTRAFSHISDVAPLIARAPLESHTASEVYNIGAGKRSTVLKLAEAVSGALGIPVSVDHQPARVEVRHAFASHIKVREAFGLEPTVSLGAGLARMAEWASTVPDRDMSEFRGEIELTAGLPPIWKERLACRPGRS